MDLRANRASAVMDGPTAVLVFDHGELIVSEHLNTTKHHLAAICMEVYIRLKEILRTFLFLLVCFHLFLFCFPSLFEVSVQNEVSSKFLSIVGPSTSSSSSVPLAPTGA